MSIDSNGKTRREFLRAAGVGTLGTLAAGGLVGSGVGSRFLVSEARAATVALSLVATDGYATVPGREDDPLYIFGFKDVTADPDQTVSHLISAYKGHTQMSAPTLDFLQNDDMRVTLTNLGLLQRPDLTDSHTIHWHGFDIPSPLNDGVPEVSVAVPIGKQLTYFYRPHREGTYMWHCHFEDVEHVQMGMTGVVFVRPVQDGNAIGGFTKFAYNDGDGSTGYHRHFAILLNEVWSVFHDGDRDIQESIPTDYDPQWFTLNGRSYPQTILPNDADVPANRPELRISTVNSTSGDTEYSQPNSSLVQANPGERVLLRLANLGYRQHAMQLPGIPMHVIGQDASLLRDGTTDTSYWTDTLYIGPGEARDVLFDAPAFSLSRPTGSDGRGTYNVYQFKNRDWRRLSNRGASGLGGMLTEVRVYQGSPLPAQTKVSETYV
jgi:FtsP/CotA-like multicopper oxidase with cupredoxin domain